MAAYLGKDRGEMLEQMTAATFREWYVLNQIYPFGEAGAYFRNAIIAAILKNTNPNRTYEVTDFLPESLWEKSGPQSPERMKDLMFLLMEKQDAYLKGLRENGGNTGA